MRSVRLIKTHHIIGLAVVALFLLYPSFSSAQTFSSPVELHGWAWSDTIGWISMNCAEGGASGENVCATSNYKVQINPAVSPSTDFLVTGYAWSENIGWIKFGGLSNYPSVPGHTLSYTNALVRYASNDYYFYGWARACAGTLSGNCSDMVNHPDGWDGWISLKSRNFSAPYLPDHYMRLDTVTDVGTGYGHFKLTSDSANAWGGASSTMPTVCNPTLTICPPDVIGQIDFDAIWFTPPCGTTPVCNGNNSETTDIWCKAPVSTSCNPLTCIPATGLCGTAYTYTLNVNTFEPDSVVVRKNTATGINWDVTLTTNPASSIGIASCRVSGSNGDSISGTASGNETTSNLIPAEVTYTLYCTPDDGSAEIEGSTFIIKTLPYISET